MIGAAKFLLRVAANRGFHFKGEKWGRTQIQGWWRPFPTVQLSTFFFLDAISTCTRSFKSTLQQTRPNFTIKWTTLFRFHDSNPNPQLPFLWFRAYSVLSKIPKQCPQMVLQRRSLYSDSNNQTHSPTNTQSRDMVQPPFFWRQRTEHLACITF